MESTAAHEAGRGGPVTRFEPLGPTDVADLLHGLASAGAAAAGRAVERVRAPALFTRVVTGLVTGPVSSALGRLEDRAVHTDWSQDVLRSGRSRRRDLDRRALYLARRVAAAVVEAVLELVDVTDVVIDHVDLDAVVRAVDLDRAVERVDLDAVVRRVDIGAIVDRVDIDAIIDRVDVDAVVARANLDRAVARVDIDAIIDRVDIDAIIDRVDIGAIIDRVDVDAVVGRADLDRAVARVDIAAIIDRVDVDAVVARADLDRAVARVDLQRIIDRIDVDGVVARADLDAVVAKLDLIALAEYVVEGIDLPGIIRSSTGSMASEGLREVRRQGIGADERVAHVVDRLLHRPERTPGSTFEEASEGSRTRHTNRPGPGDPGLVH